MTMFTPRWTTLPIDADETDAAGSVSSGSAIPVGTGGESSRASTQSISNKPGGGGGEEKSVQTPENGTARTDTTSPNDDDILLWEGSPFADGELDIAPAPRRVRDVPSGCLGPTACTVLGVCGRETCMTATEYETFAVTVGNARAASNPHRVTRLTDPQDISITSPEEADRAA